jgi:hypothetical protein
MILSLVGTARMKTRRNVPEKLADIVFMFFEATIYLVMNLID